jgi:hypothetical protein
MPNKADQLWTVTPDTKVENVAQEVVTACSNYILPWLEQFRTIADMTSKLSEVIIQHTWTEAGAHLVLCN